MSSILTFLTSCIFLVFLSKVPVFSEDVIHGQTKTERICEASSDSPTGETCYEKTTLDHISHILSLPKNYDCQNKDDDNSCSFFAEQGECEKNLNYMFPSCARSCGFCHLHDPKTRCKRHPEAKEAVKKGGINAMFERIIRDFQEYTPQVLSRDPWLVVLDNVLSKEECDALIKHGGKDFHRSVDAGEMKGEEAQFEPIVSDARTSSTDWCVRDCWELPVIQSIAAKAENITMIPRENSEFFQVLKYEKRQEYVEHHDYIYGHLDLPIGPRVYTFYIYLNGEEGLKGGGTHFFHLNYTVTPKTGRVAIWPSVRDDDPYDKEERTNHAALPVEEGVKYGANMWLHMFNFQDPFKIMCTG